MITKLFNDYFKSTLVNCISSNVFVQFIVDLDKFIYDNHKLGYNEVLIYLVIVLDISKDYS